MSFVCFLIIQNRCEPRRGFGFALQSVPQRARPPSPSGNHTQSAPPHPDSTSLLIVNCLFNYKHKITSTWHTRSQGNEHSYIHYHCFICLISPMLCKRPLYIWVALNVSKLFLPRAKKQSERPVWDASIVNRCRGGCINLKVQLSQGVDATVCLRQCHVYVPNIPWSYNASRYPLFVKNWPKLILIWKHFFTSPCCFEPVGRIDWLPYC